MNVRLMCRILGEAGHSVDLVVFPTGSPIHLKNVRILRVPNVLGVRSIAVGFSLTKLFYDFLLIFKILQLCIKKRYQVIHGIEEGGFLAVLFAKIFWTHSIFDMDSSMSEQLAGHNTLNKLGLPPVITIFERWALRAADLTITVCEALTNKARNLAPGITVVQIEDIPLQEERADESVESEVKQCLLEHELAGKKIILYTGNLEKYQGIDLLLESWQAMVFHRPELKKERLVIVGGTATQIRDYMARCSILGITKEVVFIGSRPAREMTVWMNNATGLVSPRSEGENTPLKIYTYMASGKPIIATAKKTHTQVLDDTVALLAAPKPEDFAAALAACLLDPPKAAVKGAAAARMVEEKYSYSVFQNKLLDAYERLG
ncbi:MAG: glycosyltransferase [Desulfobulbaceae bacterium]|nr:glycosyltransferase [Desulfobulbaceae bacterium]